MVDSLSARQTQFFSQDLVSVQISSLRNLERITLISGSYGPFNENTGSWVPLWLALNLKRASVCKIIIPEWLTVDNLHTAYEYEKNENPLYNLPYYWQEVAYALLKDASDDFNDLEEVKGLLEDLRYTRMQKLREGLNAINEDSETVVLTNIGATELASIREYVKHLFISINTMSNAVELAGDEDYVVHNMPDSHTQLQDE
ncbi:DNA replication complex GINS protein PSF2 [Entamoeba marina]